jgi:hypothetical protein
MTEEALSSARLHWALQLYMFQSTTGNLPIFNFYGRKGLTLIFRLNGFGFMPGKEIKAAGVGNLGLQDRRIKLHHMTCIHLTELNAERLALRWVQKYIGAFGGDPTKVTMYVLALFYIFYGSCVKSRTS